MENFYFGPIRVENNSCIQEKIFGCGKIFFIFSGEKLQIGEKSVTDKITAYRLKLDTEKIFKVVKSKNFN